MRTNSLRPIVTIHKQTCNNQKTNSYHHEARSLGHHTHRGKVETGSERVTSGGRQQHIETSQGLVEGMEWVMSIWIRYRCDNTANLRYCNTTDRMNMGINGTSPFSRCTERVPSASLVTSFEVAPLTTLRPTQREQSTNISHHIIFVN